MLYVERLDAATREALWYARTVSDGSFRAVHVPFPGSDPGIGPRFFSWTEGEPRLEILSEEDEPLDAMLEYVWRFPHGDNSFVTVVIPELFRKPSLLAAVMRRPTFRLKLGLLREPDVAVTDVPAARGRRGRRGACARDVRRARGRRPRRLAAGGPLRAVARLPRDEGRVVRVRRRGRAPDRATTGSASRPGCRSRCNRAPYRDVGKPLLTYLRRITADPEAVAVVVMPELVARGTDRLLHNQRALYLKRLLLFEPRVILTSVPYQLL